MTPHERLVIVVAAGVIVAVVVGWLFHWYVLDVSLWFRPFRGVLHGLRRDLGPDWAEDWQQEPVTDQDADVMIAEWHQDLPGPGSTDSSAHWAGEHHTAWHERMWWDDPDLTVWDARQAALRCWEILHIEFPRLRAELGIAA